MPRKSLDHFNCSWARTAEAIGDKWSIVILRNAFFGVDTFTEFLEDLGISKNILSSRLDHLMTHGILEQRPSRAGGTRQVYKLTRKGRALFPAIVALGQWGDEWLFDDKPPVVIVDRASRKPVSKVEVHDSEERPLKLGEVTFVAGPGATAATKEVARHLEARTK
ncbi:MAG: helix-turn-helix domain-containing protein [Myxococcota bacterium]